MHGPLRKWCTFPKSPIGQRRPPYSCPTLHTQEVWKGIEGRDGQLGHVAEGWTPASNQFHRAQTKPKKTQFCAWLILCTRQPCQHSWVLHFFGDAPLITLTAVGMHASETDKTWGWTPCVRSVEAALEPETIIEI
jgi:hypothetical protein